MVQPRSSALLAFPLVMSFAPALVSYPAAGEDVPAQVTTDTPAYCLQLLDRVSEMVRARSHPPEEVAELSADGERMCDQGKTRGGIMRLRRALVLLEQGQR